MDFGSFENTIDKNIETDKASDKFDQQLQAYKDAGNTLLRQNQVLKRQLVLCRKQGKLE